MIIDWLESRFDNVKTTDREAKVCCPFCQAKIGRPDTKHHLHISLEKPVAHCFRCEWSGHHLSLVMSVDGCNYSQALQEIANPSKDISLFDKITSPLGLAKGDVVASIPAGFTSLLGINKGTSLEEKAVWFYLHKRRNIPEDLIREHFGWVPGSNRVWILIDKNWWQGRSIINAEPKYISPPWPKGGSLWNAMAMEMCACPIICEGVFSAIAVGDRAMALCGKTMDPLQARRIVEANPMCLELMLDADAVQFMYDMANQLVRAGYRGKLKIRYMEFGDPADGVVGKVMDWDFSAEVQCSLQGFGTQVVVF